MTDRLARAWQASLASGAGGFLQEHSRAPGALPAQRE